MRFLDKPRADASDRTRVLHERIQWHCKGNASLWGPMMSRHLVDGADWDRLDTLAQLLGVAMGAVSGSERWHAVLSGAADPAPRGSAGTCTVCGNPIAVEDLTALTAAGVDVPADTCPDCAGELA